jgi:hypothetical protein
MAISCSINPVAMVEKRSIWMLKRVSCDTR